MFGAQVLLLMIFWKQREKENKDIDAMKLTSQFAIHLGFALCGVASFPALSYEIPVHKNISSAAFNQALASHDFLSALGISSTQGFKGNTPEGWVTEGSAHEDDYFRPVHHFFDPTTGLGLNGTFLGTPYNFTAAPNWAMDSASNPLYSIPEAYQSFYLALTASDPMVRENAWAETFRAVGQFTHLLQDMAQPQHVRNDAHLSISEKLDWLFPDFSRYERYTLTQVGNLNYNSGYPIVNMPLSAAYWSDGSGKGLAEFTNKNFVSEGTNFGTGKYALPDIGSTFNWEDVWPQMTSLDGVVYNNITVRYVGNTYSDVYQPDLSGTNNYLSAFSVFDFVHRQYVGTPVYTMTDKNHQAYADILIPRATGYSAGLINYFFRGKIDIVVDPNNPGSFVIKNLGYSDMFGYFSLYYDDINGIRTKAGSGWNLGIPANAQSQSLSVTTPISPAPALPGKYYLVFTGTIGQDVRTAVTAKAVTINGGYYLVSAPSNVYSTLNQLGNAVFPGATFTPYAPHSMDENFISPRQVLAVPRIPKGYAVCRSRSK